MGIDVMRPGSLPSSPETWQPGRPLETNCPASLLHHRNLIPVTARGTHYLIFLPHAELVSLYSDPFLCHQKAKAVSSSQAPTLPLKPPSS